MSVGTINPAPREYIWVRFEELFLADDNITTLGNRNTAIEGTYKDVLDIFVDKKASDIDPNEVFQLHQVFRQAARLGEINLERTTFKTILDQCKQVGLGAGSSGLDGLSATAINSGIDQLEEQEEARQYRPKRYKKKVNVCSPETKKPTMAGNCERAIRILGGSATPAMIRKQLVSAGVCATTPALDWIRTVLRRNTDRFIEVSHGTFKINPDFRGTLKEQITAVIQRNQGEASTAMIFAELRASDSLHVPNKVSILNLLSAQFQRVKKGTYRCKDPNREITAPVTLSDHIAVVLRNNGPTTLAGLVPLLKEKGVELSKNAYYLVKQAVKRGIQSKKFFSTGKKGEYGLMGWHDYQYINEARKIFDEAKRLQDSSELLAAYRRIVEALVHALTRKEPGADSLAAPLRTINGITDDASQADQIVLYFKADNLEMTVRS